MKHEFLFALAMLSAAAIPRSLVGQGTTVPAGVSRPGAVAVVIAVIGSRGVIIDSASLTRVAGLNPVTIDSMMAMIPPGAVLGAVKRSECTGERERYCMMFRVEQMSMLSDTAIVKASWGPVKVMDCAGLSATFRVVMEMDWPVLVSKTDEVVRSCMR